jgi:branched-chain amino acid transport system ATP-binding protein
MTNTNTPLLKVQGVNKRFGGLQALSEVGLTIELGQIYGLIGPNGAGKTTFFNVITGLYPPDSGTFRLRGVPYSPRSVHQVTEAGIARTFQNIRLFGSMTALENVMVGRHLRSRSSLIQTILRTRAFHESEASTRKRAKELLQYVGVGHLEDKLARTLSYGDQRRLEIARALATEPVLLALDEPAAGMNPSEKATLRRLLEKIREDGVSILLIEHDVKLVMGLCDEITALDRGREIVKGAPERVRANPEFIKAYLGKPHLELVV